jgi:hypothetical protein
VKREKSKIVQRGKEAKRKQRMGRETGKKGREREEMDREREEIEPRARVNFAENDKQQDKSKRHSRNLEENGVKIVWEGSNNEPTEEA